MTAAPTTTPPLTPWLLAAVVAVGCTAAFAAWLYATSGARQVAESHFAEHAAEEIAAIRLTLIRTVDTVDDLAMLYSEQLLAPAARSTNGFARLAEQWLSDESALQGLGWNEEVSGAERAAYELNAQRENPGFRIVAPGPDGTLQAAPPAARHVVVRYIHPQPSNRAAHGLDTYAEPRRRAAVDRARSTGMTSATAPIRLVQESEDQRSVLVVAPAAGTQAPPGYVVAVLRLGDVISGALSPEQPGNFGVELRDVDAPAGEQLLFAVSAPGDAGLAPLRYPLEFAGRNWQVTFTAGAALAPGTATTILLPLVVMLATTLIATWLLLVSRRNSALTRALQERTQAELALAESEQRLTLTVDSLFTGGWDMDLERNRMILSDSYQKALGYAPGDLPLQPSELADHIHPDDRHTFQSALAAYLQGGDGTFEAEYRMLHRDGTPRIHATRGKVVRRRPDGTPARLVGVSQDVTEERQQQAHRAELETRVREAQKLDSLGLLAGSVAHDFNNLLVGVLTTAELACSTTREPDTRAQLAQITDAAQRAADLAREMLTYAGRGEIVLGPVDPAAVIAEMQPLLATSVGSRHYLDVTVDDDARALNLHGDATQLRQVLMNLAVNAADAMTDTPGRVVIRLSRHTVSDSDPDGLSPGQFLCLQVSDTGCGMDEATRARALEPFFSTKSLGRGLGLASVAGIVRGHRGSIHIDSTPGAGTTVTVLLPGTDRAAPAASTPQAAPTPTSTGTASDLRVLVVDDDDMVRRVASGLLARSGHICQEAENGVMALELLRQGHEIDVVLLDASMPGLSGLDTFARILAEGHDVPVVMMSGYVDKNLDEDERFEALAGFVHKPFTAADLKRVIAAAAAGHGLDVRRVG